MPSLYWPDEIFQTLEQAHRAAFGYGIVPWEFRDGLRSWLFPGFLAGVMWVTEPLASGSRGYLSGVIFTLCAISLIPSIVGWRWAKRQVSGAAVVLAVAVPVVWMELVYFAPKAFYEVVTAHLFVGGIYLCRFADGGWWRPFVGGAVIGLCCAMRLQLFPAVVMVSIATVAIADYPHHRFSGIVTGCVVGLGLGGLVDAVVLGAPFQSLISNYYINLIEGKASQWGTSPWWQYMAWMWEVSSVGTVVLGSGLLFGLVRFPALAWPAVVVLGAHSYIGHKEYRFIYPVFVLGSVCTGLAVGLLVQSLERWVDAYDWVGQPQWAAMGLSVALGGAVAGVSWTSADDFNLRTRGGTGEVTNWRLRGGELLAFRQVSARGDVCGVGLHGFSVVNSGAYVYLHNDVPMVRFGWGDGLSRHISNKGGAVNYIVSDAVTPGRDDMPGAFEIDRCLASSEVCILERPGSCREPKDGEPINRSL
jgi:hypothetical protein